MASKYLGNTGLTHLWEKIKGLFAPLSSPTFTGVPIAPTAATTTNSTQIATTQYVQNNMAEIDISKLRDSATDNIFGTQDGSNGIAHSLNRLMYFRDDKVTNMNAVYKTGFYGTANTDSSMPYKGYWFVAVFCKDETRQIAVQWAMDTNKDYNGQLWMRTVRINAADTASGNIVGTWKKFADVDDIPTKMSQLTNDGEFATKAAADLTNYYLKSDTYTKAEVTALIGAISSVSISVVTTLPTTGESNIIYFVSKTGTAGDVYDEYVWISTAYEHIGSTSVDLNNYYTKTDADAELAKKVNIDGTTPMAYLDVGDRKAGSTVGKYSVSEGGDKLYVTDVSTGATSDMSNIASGYSSHAEGMDTLANKEAAHAEGIETYAKGIASHSEGECSSAKGNYSHAEGYATEANNSASHAGGYCTIAAGENQTAIGMYNVEDATGTDLFIVGNGTSDTAKSNAFTVSKTGDITASNEVIDGKGNKLSDKATIKTIAVTIPTSSWASNAATVVATGVTADNSVIITPAPASYTAYCESWIVCTTQAANSLTFSCEAVPAADITVNIMIVEV